MLSTDSRDTHVCPPLGMPGLTQAQERASLTQKDFLSQAPDWYRSNMVCRHLLRSAAAVAIILASTVASSAETEEEISIEALLKAGWQIAGYSSTFDNRSTFILFRHPDEKYLVQCQAGYDVTRSPRMFSHCYKLR